MESELFANPVNVFSWVNKLEETKAEAMILFWFAVSKTVLERFGVFWTINF